MIAAGFLVVAVIAATISGDMRPATQMEAMLPGLITGLAAWVAIILFIVAIIQAIRNRGAGYASVPPPAVALADSPAAVLGVWRVVGSEIDNVVSGDEVALGIDGAELVITKAASGEADRRQLDVLAAIGRLDGRTEVTVGRHVLLDLDPVAGSTDRLAGVLNE